MSKKAKRNAIKNSNEHVYSKGPLYRVQSDFDVSPTGQMASFYKGRDKEIIAKYIHEAWTLEKQINLPEESVYNVWFNMGSEEMQGIFLENVLRKPGFNPYTDKLPVEDMPEELKNEVVKIQDFLRENFGKKIAVKKDEYILASTYYYEPARVRMKEHLQYINLIVMSKYCFVGMWFRDGDVAKRAYDILSDKVPDEWVLARKCVYAKSPFHNSYFLSEENLEALWKEANMI